MESRNLKDFSQDKFFKVSRHPGVKRYPDSAIQQVAVNLGLNDDSGNAIPRPEPRSSVRRDPVKPDLSDLPENPGNLKSIQIGPTPQAGDPHQVARDPAGDPHQVARDPAGDPPPDDGKSILESTEGYEFLLSGAYTLLFHMLGKKQGIDMSLTEDEKQELSNATVPVLKKYVKTDFRYGEEVNFALVLSTVYSRKLNGDAMEEKGGKEILENLDNEENQDILTKGFGGLYSEYKDKLDEMVPVELNDIQYREIKKFLEAIGVQATKESAGKFMAFCNVINIPFAHMQAALKLIGAEKMKEIIQRNTVA